MRPPNANRSRENQQALARETEQRLVIDTVAQVLELITVEGVYAPKARVAGAIATLMQLRSGTVAIRILGELWTADAIDPDTACWLIDRVVQDSLAGHSTSDDARDAIVLLVMNAVKILPAPDAPNQYAHFWPESLRSSWPSRLSYSAKNAIVVAAVNVLLVREIAYWKGGGGNHFPLHILIGALDDPAMSGPAATVLAKLLEVDAFALIGLELPEVTRQRIGSAAGPINAWFDRLLSQFEPWAKGQQPDQSVQTAPVAAVADQGLVLSQPPAPGLGGA